MVFFLHQEQFFTSGTVFTHSCKNVIKYPNPKISVFYIRNSSHTCLRNVMKHLNLKISVFYIRNSFYAFLQNVINYPNPKVSVFYIRNSFHTYLQNVIKYPNPKISVFYIRNSFLHQEQFATYFCKISLNISTQKNISFLHQEQFYHKKGSYCQSFTAKNGTDIQEILVSN